MTATTERYILSLHDALPIFGHKGDPCFDNGCSAFGTCGGQIGFSGVPVDRKGCGNFGLGLCSAGACLGHTPPPGPPMPPRSEEHTSELQSHSELVCRLLLEK